MLPRRAPPFAARLLRAPLSRLSGAAPPPPLASAAAAAAAGTTGARRCSSSSGSGSGPEPRDPKRASFWDKWEDGENGVQDFYQQVGFGHDLAAQQKWLPGAKKKTRPTTRRRGAEFEEEDDEYFLEDVPSSAGPPGAEARARAAAYAEATSNLYSGEGVAPSRRAELLGLLEDLGPDAFAPPPSYAEEVELRDEGDEQEVREKRMSAMAQLPTFMASVAARESGQLAPGSYFTYVLHTRRVSKRGPDGSRLSYSVLVVVGNGSGTAGLGMGKDLVPNVALMKATHAARKNLVHLDRFDGRTIFHDMEGWYGPTKVVIRMRRAFSGTRCNWLSWKIFSAFGISDLSCRVHGSTSNINQARCIVNTLMRMDTPQLIASRRGKRVLDMTARNHANPRPALGPRNYA